MLKRVLRININNLCSNIPFRGISETDLYDKYTQVHIYDKINRKFTTNEFYVKQYKFYNTEHLFIDSFHMRLISQFAKNKTFPQLERIFTPQTTCNSMLLHPGDKPTNGNITHSHSINHLFNGKVELVELSQHNYNGIIVDMDQNYPF